MFKVGLGFTLLQWFLLLFSISCSKIPIELSHAGTDRVGDPTTYSRPYVLLVSIDGYRHDYTDRYHPPALTRFRDEGSRAKALIPVFPSKTFTNHYSIVSGLYADKHGIVGNSFYDPARKAEYRLSDPKAVTDGTWYGGTPLWVAAEKQGMLAACFFWPGSEADIQGTRPTYYFRYDQKVPLDTRVNQIRQWLELPDNKRPHFMTLYFSDVDSAGHEYGPDSKEVEAAVLKVDGAIAKLMDNIKASGRDVDVIIVSDHGMQLLDPQKVEYLDDYAKLAGVRTAGTGPVMFIYEADKEKSEVLYRTLKTKENHFKVYRRSELPARMHLADNPRAGDLVVMATAPYSVTVHGSKGGMETGSHGYDPDVTPTMRGIFYARGPHLKEGTTVEAFRNVDIYPLVMKLLGLKTTNPIDGHLETLEKIIK